MISRTVTCDICGKTTELVQKSVTEDIGKYNLRFDWVIPDDWSVIDNYLGIPAKHLCPACFCKFNSDVRQYVYDYFESKHD